MKSWSSCLHERSLSWALRTANIQWLHFHAKSCFSESHQMGGYHTLWHRNAAMRGKRTQSKPSLCRRATGSFQLQEGFFFKKKKSNFRSTLKYHQAIKLKGPALRSETNKAKFPNKVGIHLKKQCATTLNMKINYWKMMLREPRFNSARGSSARRAAGSQAMRQRDELILRPPTAADPPCWGQRRWTLQPAFKRWGK